MTKAFVLPSVKECFHGPDAKVQIRSGLMKRGEHLATAACCLRAFERINPSEWCTDINFLGYAASRTAVSFVSVSVIVVSRALQRKYSHWPTETKKDRLDSRNDVYTRKLGSIC